MSPLKNKVILITGSAIRIGRAISQSLSGAKLLLHYYKSKSEVISLEKELTAKGCDCSVFQANFNHKDEIQSLFDHAKNRFGHLDVLINNASMFEKKSLLHTSEIEAALRLNLNSSFALCSTSGPSHARWFTHPQHLRHKLTKTSPGPRHAQSEQTSLDAFDSDPSAGARPLHTGQQPPYWSCPPL